MKFYTFRIRPGEDLFEEIEAFVKDRGITAGAVVTCVGSLNLAILRLADRERKTKHQGPFEIVSLAGTVSVHGSHLHLSISDQEGSTFGGHLLAGCRVYTTAEVVLVSFPDLVYKRERCQVSGYPELVVYDGG